jgi:site-specific DNA recombinase
LSPNSAISTIVVHHSSRFTRDATHARIVKSKLRRAGVRVLSVSQDIPDDLIGKLMEGFFECIDQYESELNGLRTSAAMREAVRQGFYPGGRAPYGYRTVPVELRPGVTRHRLVIDPAEAEIVRELFRLYVTECGAKGVAAALNQRGYRIRSGALWSKDTVLWIIDQPAVVGTFLWGRHRQRSTCREADWLELKVEPIVDERTYALAQELRRRREPSRSGGRYAARPHVLTRLLRCGRCGSSYQLETSGKRVDGGLYRYCYYNCRRATRIGVDACSGFRIATDILDQAVLEAIADHVCSGERVNRLALARRWPAEQLRSAWRALVTCDPDTARAYALHLIDRVEVHGERIVVVPRLGGRTEPDESTEGIAA